MLRPRALRLDSEIAAIAQDGVTLVLSLLEPAEAASLGLRSEGEEVQKAGLTFANFAIPDMQLPEPIEFEACIRDLVDQIKGGAHIAVHCRASIGRSGMVAAGVLGALGVDGPEAISRISAARGVDVPDTPEQATFISEMYQRLRP